LCYVVIVRTVLNIVQKLKRVIHLEMSANKKDRALPESRRVVRLVKQVMPLIWISSVYHTDLKGWVLYRNLIDLYSMPTFSLRSNSLSSFYLRSALSLGPLLLDFPTKCLGLR